MPSELQHAPGCDQVPWEHPELSLSVWVYPHKTRTGAVHVVWSEACTTCGRRLTYVDDVVAHRNVLKHVRATSMIYVSTWHQRQGLWGDQPLPDLS